ncbi:C40 family peptidase [Kitasatospora sp. A2-31]|uniref:C40 family peptidase n=1 Tax=Kitasatospora sp. A2-31 TaxID=2916414 RepID=UPI001EEC4762|nr:C40 family peptidase [Kitasatospora sp. A2-31]MCG6494056.1 C40 family peptidase [Kitasatospora sp. A2-31]
MKHIRRSTAAALAAAVLGSLVLTGPAVALPAGAPSPAAVSEVADPVLDTEDEGGEALDAGSETERAAAPRITRAEEIRRAKVWLTDNAGRAVPYSQKKTWKDGYRQDCSGYASMALKLPKSGPNTVSLKNDGWTKPIAMQDLRQGDLVIKANSNDPNHRHVVIFDGWADGKHASYWSYEQAGKVGTRRATHNYGLKSGDGYHAHRPVNLVD